MKTKQSYEKPLTAVTQVELESPICSGSAIIVNNENNGTGIEAQETNITFDAGSQTTGGNNANGWDYTGTTN